jgi:hypothetical protein
MDVFLIPVGPDRYELYCETPEEDPSPSGSTHGGLFRKLILRFREAIAEVERERHQAREPSPQPRSLFQRAKRLVLCRIAETIAEQRLLWHLRRQHAVTALHPDDLPSDAAMGLVNRSLRSDYEKHRRWMLIDGVLFVLSGLLVLVPGPNVIAYYLAFRLVGHYLSMRGARQGLDQVKWTLRPSAVLAELRHALAMEADERVARVKDIAARLRLERLVPFFLRTAVPSA